MKITVEFKTEHDTTVKEFEEGLYNSGLERAFKMVESLADLGGVVTLTVQPDEPKEKFYYIYEHSERMNHVTSERHCTCNSFVRGLAKSCCHMYRLSSAPVSTLLPASRQDYETLLKSRYPHSVIGDDGRKLV